MTQKSQNKCCCTRQCSKATGKTSSKSKISEQSYSSISEKLQKHAFSLWHNWWRQPHAYDNKHYLKAMWEGTGQTVNLEWSYNQTETDMSET